MEKEEVELIPSGLVTCLLDGDKEVRILKISPQSLTVRIDEEIEDNIEVKLEFFIFDEYRYEEVVVKNHSITKVIKEEFYITYSFSIKDDKYSQSVRKITKNYWKYIMLKNFGDENEFSKEMVGYPAEKDYDFYSVYSDEKRDWMLDINNNINCTELINTVELAILLDNDILYKKYMENDKKNFQYQYLKDNFIDNNNLFKKQISRIYVGNEFCHNLFPDMKLLLNILEKAKNEQLDVTICFTYIREDYIEKNKDIIENLYNWCIENNKKIEIVVNDWGMLSLIKGKEDYFTASLGVLLNKRKKDPRYMYKKGYIENKEIIAKNSVNSRTFKNLLNSYKIERYEYESCGYEMLIAEGKHSLHLPFYQTNTSQYCILYAMCTNLDRGNQKLVKQCPKYCTDYVFSYPKHLKIIGRYNSLFAFDDVILKDYSRLEKYLNNGIDRIVLNFI